MAYFHTNEPLPEELDYPLGVWSEMKQLGVVLSPRDYEEMPYWISELILMFIEVQADYQNRQQGTEDMSGSD